MQESPYDGVLEDEVTGYGDAALEDRVTDYGTSIALANKGAGRATSGISSSFKKDITVWSERNQRKVAENFGEALFPVADIFDLMFPGEDPQDRIKKAVGLAIGKRVIEYGQKIVKLNPIQEAAKKILEKAFELLQEDAEKEERLEKRQFIENYRTFQDRVQKDLKDEIRAQADVWMQQVAGADDKRAEEAKITPVLDEKSDLEIQQTDRIGQLSNAMKLYWDMQSPTANFEIPAGQPYEAISPVVPVKIRANWRDVIKAIKAGDSSWTSISGRPIHVKWGSSEHTYGPDPGDESRQRVESFLVPNRKLLEDSQ